MNQTSVSATLVMLERIVLLVSHEQPCEKNLDKYNSNYISAALFSIIIDNCVSV